MFKQFIDWLTVSGISLIVVILITVVMLGFFAVGAAFMPGLQILYGLAFPGASATSAS